MFKSVLIIDNDIRYVDSLQQKLQSKFDFTYEIVTDFEDIQKITKVSEYDLYFIRLNLHTLPLIDKLDDDEKTIIVLTNKWDEDTRSKILALGVTDYIITDNSAHGMTALNIVQRLVNNKQRNILLVDDSVVILNTLSILLDVQNLNYIKCKSAYEAWDYLNDEQSKKIDLIICDYEMPGMSGYDLTKRVRSKYLKEELPILLLSGTQEESMIAKFLKAGVNDYIPKPFINEEFINRLSNTLNTLEMYRALKYQ